jgi:exopolysaccharide biosynthesis polyprenyl glycosylphosphotransferase
MPRLRTLALILGDFAVLILSYTLTFLALRWLEFVPYLELSDYLLIDNGAVHITLVVITMQLTLYWLGQYEDLRVRSRRVLFETLIFALGSVFLLQAIASYLKSSIVLSRWIMMFGSITALVSLLAWRSLYSLMLIRVLDRQRVLFWNDSTLIRQVASHIEAHPEKGYLSIGCVGAPLPEAGPFPGGHILLLGRSLLESIHSLNPTRIVVFGSLPSDNQTVSALIDLNMRGVRIENVSELYEELFQQIPLESITTSQLVFNSSFQPSQAVVFWQTFYSVLISILGILLTWPLMLLTAIAVRLDSPGPALLRQRRVGKNGRIFHILKFRSMYIDADKRFGRTRASTNDPRITRVGSFIRVTRLDELPQFFNVLFGEMHLVGPRPEMPEYVEELSANLPLYTQRVRVKPGITGWAQLHHRPEVDLTETSRKIQYDLYYIKHISIAFDFLIMFHTIKAIFARTGAR